jgi:hypothetical protein
MRSVASPRTTMAPASRSAWTTLRLLRMIAACSDARRPLARRRSRNEGVVACVRANRGAEVGVGADEHSALHTGRVDDDGVGRAGHADVSHVHDLMAAGAEEARESGGEVVVEQEPHAEWRSGSSRSRTASAAYRSASATSSGARSGSSLVISATVMPSATIATTVADRDAQAPDGRHAAHHVRVNRDPLERHEVSVPAAAPRGR